MVTKEATAEARTKTVQLAKEIDLKLRLLVDGIRIDDSALEGVGTTYEERHLDVFEHRRSAISRKKIPDCVILPYGGLANLKHYSDSPYVLKREDGHLVIKRGHTYLSEVSYPLQPSYYGKKTSDGVDMRLVLAGSGKDMLEYEISYFCQYDRFGGRCAFCNINWTQQQHREEMVPPHKRLRQLEESLAEAIKDSRWTHMWCTGGMMPEATQTKTIVAAMRSMKEVLGVDKLPLGLSITAPAQRETLEELRSEGLQAIAHNMEVWHPDYFRAICPGKNTIPGRDGWIQALKWAVDIFGKGNVRCLFVAGIEPMEYTLEGIEYLCSLGIAALPNVWAPHLGSKLQNHRPPTVEWYQELFEKCVPIWFKYGIADTKPGLRQASLDPCLCLDCPGSSIVKDEIKRRVLLNNPSWVCPSLPPLNSLARKH